MIGINLIIVLILLTVVVAVLIGLVGLFFRIVPGLKVLRDSLPLLLRKWLFYQLFGLSLLGTIIFALSIPIPSIMNLEDVAMDTVMFLHKGNIPSREDTAIPPFILLDIDNKTHKSWGAPKYTPREKIKNLIDSAVQAKARLIIVDIDISQYSSLNKKPQADDLVLAEYLKNYAIQCKKTQSDCSPIILARTFSDEVTPKSNLLIPRIGFFDEVVAQSFPYVQWGESEFYVSSPNMTRRWGLWEATCTEGQPGVIPSIELLAMGMIRGCSHKEIENALLSLKPENCDNYLPPDSITFCGFTTSTNINSVEQRIMYRMPYPDAEENKAITTMPDNQGNTVLTILSAKPYAESPLPPDTLETIPDNSVVVIGGSYGSPGCFSPDNDIHCTPIDEEMPGALVIINAIYSLLQDLTIKPMSSWWLVIALVIIISLFSLIPEQSNNQRDKIVRKSLILIIFFIIAGLFVYSVILFEDGTWLDIAVPVAIIGICQKIYQSKFLKNFVNKSIGIHALEIETPNNTNK